ncbi:Ubiquinol cytochrome reductase transmembrane region [Trichostrongylus colubriformis]|uniref:Ubiquinol cytochrome reductase transmembrane region n=1 Tax=Trichostrongylus colubriformis TaxID=6319 RepID=A0AAN8F5U9_TRICO
MSTLARSGNVATKVVCGSQHHTSFVVAAPSSKVTPIKDVVTEFKTPDSLQAAASRGTNHRGLLSSNFAFKGINVSSRRMAHTDVKFPDFSKYRREVTLDTQKAARETEDQRRSLSHAVYYGAGGVMSLWAAKEIAQVSVLFKAMAADQRALASIEINLDEIPEGVTKTYEWPNAGDFGGYFCPCHGSHYDASGRIRKGPAPLNLHVPAYSFKGNVVVIGSN